MYLEEIKMRLIDADVLIEGLEDMVNKISDIRHDNQCFLTKENVLELINEQPTLSKGNKEMVSIKGLN